MIGTYAWCVMSAWVNVVSFVVVMMLIGALMLEKK